MESRLRKLRGNKTLETVANAVGITTASLSYYENGKRTPRDSVKKELAKYYKRSVSYIFFSDDTNSELAKD